MNYIKPLPLAISLAMTAGLAHADSTAKKVFTLDKVTVAATLTEQKVEDVANTVTVIDAETIEKNATTNIRDLVRYEPGVSVGNEAGSDRERFGNQGFNIRGMEDNRVKIVVDGVDQPKAFAPSGQFFQRNTRNYVDMDSLKRVEIIKGPASSLYGSDALGGLVAYTTKDPSDYLKQEGNDTAGSIKIYANDLDDNFTQTLTLANRTGRLESLLTYTNRDAKEAEAHDDVELEKDEVDADSKNLLLKLQYQLTDTQRIGLTVEDYKNDTFTDMPRKLASFGGAFYSQFYHGDDTTTRKRVSLTHEWQADTALFDTSKIQLDWQDSEQDQETTSIVFGSLRTKDYTNQEELKRLSGQFNKALDNHTITYGFEYKDIELTNTQDTIYPNNPAGNTFDRGYPLIDGTDYAVYLQDQISLMDGKLVVTPGIRYDSFEAETKVDADFAPPAQINVEDFSDHDSDKVTVRLGAVYKFTEEWSGFAQYSQGFKSPDLLHLYAASYRNYGPGMQYLTLPNPGLKPEKSDSYEVGVRFKNDKGNFELVGFYNDYTDFIDSRVVGTEYDGTAYDSVSTNENVGDVVIKGIEARASVWLDSTVGAPEGTSLQVALAYADGENKSDDEPLDSVSPLNGVIGLAYDAPSDLWGSNLTWTLVDGKKQKDISSDTGAASKGYGLLDMSAYYNVTPQLTIRANINNITDKKYRVWDDIRKLGDTTDLDRYTQPGRNFALSATYSF